MDDNPIYACSQLNLSQSRLKWQMRDDGLMKILDIYVGPQLCMVLPQWQCNTNITFAMFAANDALASGNICIDSN